MKSGNLLPASLANACLAACLMFCCGDARSEDWPRWRGPRGDGTWNAPKIASDWSTRHPQRVWQQPVGGGYSGVTVADGRVYTCDRQIEPQQAERVICLRADTGEPLWTFSYAVEYADLPYGTGPRASPTVADGLVYCLGAVGHLHCLQAATGVRLWSRDLVRDDQGRMPTWGYAASPIVFENLLIVQPGGQEQQSVVALDRLTGKRIWHSLADQAAYASPVLFDHNGNTNLICWTPSHVRCLDPRNGNLLWSVPYEVTMGVSIATPIVADRIVFVSGYWEGSKAIRLAKDRNRSQLIWEENRNLRGLMSQPLYRQGYAYLLDKQYGMTCFLLESGKKIWDDANRLTPRGRNPQVNLVWLNDEDRVLALNSDGELILARLNPAGCHELARWKLIGPTWAHPGFAGNSVYARSDTEVLCVKLPLAQPE